MIATKVIEGIKTKNEEAVQKIAKIKGEKHLFMLKVPKLLWEDFEHLYITLKGTTGIKSRESLILYLMEVATKND